MPLLPLTSTTTRRKQTDTPFLRLLHSVMRPPLRWGTDHGRHRLGVNRVPFIWLDAAGGLIRRAERGWGRGRPMLSQPLKVTSSLGTLQTTVKLIKLPKKMSQCVWWTRQWEEMRIIAIGSRRQVKANLLCHWSDSVNSFEDQCVDHLPLNTATPYFRTNLSYIRFIIWGIWQTSEMKNRAEKCGALIQQSFKIRLSEKERWVLHCRAILSASPVILSREAHQLLTAAAVSDRVWKITFDSGYSCGWSGGWTLIFRI